MKVNMATQGKKNAVFIMFAFKDTEFFAGKPTGTN